MFKQWLMNEAFDIEIAPHIKAIPSAVGQSQEPVKFFSKSEFLNFMRGVLTNYFRGDLQRITQRYRIVLDKFTDDYEPTFTFSLQPLGKGTPEYVAEDDPLYDYYAQHKGGKTGWTHFSSPKDAIENIPVRPDWVYRGMSWEEWQYIRRTGQIMSNAGYNLGGQENLTFYGNAETAMFYSNNFAPIQFKASIRKPGVVIAVPRDLVMSHEDHEHIPEGEFAHQGPLDAQQIAAAWMLVPTRARSGSFEIRFDWRRSRDSSNQYSGNFVLANPKEGSSHHPSISTAIRKIL